MSKYVRTWKEDNIVALKSPEFQRAQALGIVSLNTHIVSLNPKQGLHTHTRKCLTDNPATYTHLATL